jgi:hypothetical protein
VKMSVGPHTCPSRVRSGYRDVHALPLPARTSTEVVAATEGKDKYRDPPGLDVAGGADIAAGNGGQEGVSADRLTEFRQGSRTGWVKRRRAGGDRGAGSAEIVIAVPLLMLLILLVIQFAVWEHAEGIAHATAEEALAAARVRGGTAASGQQRATQVISQIGSSVLVGPQVSVTMTPADVTVEVTGTAERVLPVPGLSFPVTVTVTGPVERFVPATARG